MLWDFIKCCNQTLDSGNRTKLWYKFSVGTLPEVFFPESRIPRWWSYFMLVLIRREKKIVPFARIKTSLPFRELFVCTGSSWKLSLVTLGKAEALLGGSSKNTWKGGESLGAMVSAFSQFFRGGSQVYPLPLAAWEPVDPVLGRKWLGFYLCNCQDDL